MKLVINRDQQAMKGMLGGNKGVQFTLRYRLVLTAEEQALVNQYKLEYYPLTFSNQGGTRMADDTIGNMVQGRSTSVSDVTTLVRNEEIIKDACDTLPVLFSMVRTFGGEETIDYPRAKGAG